MLLRYMLVGFWCRIDWRTYKIPRLMRITKPSLVRNPRLRFEMTMAGRSARAKSVNIFQAIEHQHFDFIIYHRALTSLHISSIFNHQRIQTFTVYARVPVFGNRVTLSELDTNHN